MENRLIRNVINKLTLDLNKAYSLSRTGIFEMHEANPNIYYQFTTSFNNKKFLYMSPKASFTSEVHNFGDIHTISLNDKYFNIVKVDGAKWVLIKSYEYKKLSKIDVYGELNEIFPLPPKQEELEYIIGEKIPNRKIKQFKLWGG